MKKTRGNRASAPTHDAMLAEYDFSKACPNPYARFFGAQTVAVVLEPDVAARFPSARAVNSALRAVARTTPRKRRGRNR